MSPGPRKPNPSPFSMTKINVTNNIIFVTDSIAMSHNDDMEDDVAADMAMTWIAMMTCKNMIDDVAVMWKVVMTWPHMDADIDSDVAVGM